MHACSELICSMRAFAHSPAWPSTHPTGPTCTQLPSLPAQILEYYDLEHVNKWAWLGWEALFFVAFLAAAWAALSLVRHQRR